MTPLAAAALAFTASYAAWALVRRVATARCIAVGTLPPIVAIGASIVVAAASAHAALAPGAIAAIATVGTAAIVDLRSGSIFDPLTAALVVVALGLALLNGTLLAALAGGAVAGGTLLALYAATKRRGIGLGDVKLAAGIGAGLGAANGELALAIAFVIGGIYGGWLLIARRARRGERLRFGPFIAAGTYAAVLLPVGLR